MEKIREIIRKEIQSLFEDFQYRYDGNFYPNQSMIKNCLDALNAVEKNDLIKTISNNNEGSGKIKAKKIVEKQPITHSQLKRKQEGKLYTLLALFNHGTCGEEMRESLGVTIIYHKEKAVTKPAKLLGELLG